MDNAYSSLICENALTSIHLDVQAGTAAVGSGAIFHLTPQEMILLYWLALGASEERIGRALELDHAEVTDGLATLRQRLGLNRAVAELDLSNGRAPSSAWPWPQRTAVTIIQNGLARKNRDPLVYVAGEGTLTAEEVSDLVRRIGAGLRREGVGKGGWVAVDATQRLESFLVALATLLVGGVVVRLGDSVGPATLRNMVMRAPAAMTFSARFAQVGVLQQTGKRVSFLDEEGVPKFSDWIKACPEPIDDLERAVTVSPSDPALVGFTSGSTGEPKVILNSHEAVFRTTEVAVNWFDLRPDDIFCSATDFTALSAFRSMVTLPLFCGGRVVLPTEEARRHPLALGRLCETFAVTRLTAVPNVLRGFVKAGNRLKKDSLSALRTVFSGSGVLDRATAEMFGDRFGAPIADYYGGREIGTVAYSAPDMPGTMISGGGWASEVLIRILNEDGTPCARGRVGEICVHTDSVMLGCLPAVGTDGAVRNGWYWTGDLGRFHPDGRIEITGRRRDIVKTQEGGLVCPVEVENVLHASEAVHEACVFGWSDRDGIEKLGASIILAEDRNGDELKTIAMQIKIEVENKLGPYKVPMQIMFLQDFPRVSQGKPDKEKMRKDLEVIVRKKINLF